MRITIKGVHPIEAQEPVHLVEVALDDEAKFDWGKVTQEMPGQSQSNWQVAYDKQKIGANWVFFFHYLDFGRPLLMPAGEIAIPNPTPLPLHLISVEYLQP